MTAIVKKREKKPFIPRSKDPKLNLYSPDDIMKAGGLATFSKLIGNDKPIAPPNIHFSDKEWDEMMKHLD